MNDRIIMGISLMLIVVLVGCTNEETVITDTSQHDDPDYLFMNSPDIDMIVYEVSAYVNASDVDWVATQALEKGDEIGLIQDTYTVDTKDLLTSTKLPKGTIVYESEKDNIILVDIDGEVIPYLQWIEG